MPRAVVCGRTSPPRSFSSWTNSRTRRYRSSTAEAVGQTEGDRSTAATAELTHPRDLGARRGVRPRNRARPTRGALRTRRAPTARARRRTRAARRAWPRCPARAARRARGGASVREVEMPNAPAPIASSTRALMAAHVVVGSRRLVEAALAHGVHPHRAVAHHAADVDALRPTLDLARGTRRRSPTPRTGPRGCSTRGCPRPTPSSRRGSARSFGPARGEGHAAVAEHDRGDAVPARRATPRGPRPAGRRGACGCRRSRG